MRRVDGMMRKGVDWGHHERVRRRNRSQTSVQDLIPSSKILGLPYIPYLP